METSREDVSIAIRSAFLKKGIKQRFSLIALILLSIIFLFIESIETKPLDYLRSFIKDVVYRSSLVVASPSKGFNLVFETTKSHITLYRNFKDLKKENENLKNKISKSEFLELENNQLRKLIDDQIESPDALISARVMLDKQSPYLNSLVLNSGSNKGIKNGLAVLDGNNFIGRIVDVNFFSSRVLLATDLNSKIPVIIEPSGNQAILSGHGLSKPTLEYLPENYSVQEGDRIYTSGKEGIFSPGIPIGVVNKDKGKVTVLLFSELNQISFVNVKLESKKFKE